MHPTKRIEEDKNMANIYKVEGGRGVAMVAGIVNGFLTRQENMETQVLRLEDGAVILQGRGRGGKAMQFLGMDKATSVKIEPVGSDHVSVEIGGGKWADKGVVMAGSMFVLWPLAVTSGIGMAKQGTLPKKIFRAIERGLAGGFTAELQSAIV